MSGGLLSTIALGHPFGFIPRPPSGAPPHTVSWERCAVVAVSGGRWVLSTSCHKRTPALGDRFFVLKIYQKSHPITSQIFLVGARTRPFP